MTFSNDYMIFLKNFGIFIELISNERMKDLKNERFKEIIQTI